MPTFLVQVEQITITSYRVDAVSKEDAANRVLLSGPKVVKLGASVEGKLRAFPLEGGEPVETLYPKDAMDDQKVPPKPTTH